MARKGPRKDLRLEDAVALLSSRYGGRLAPPLEGLAYRFTIWLPILSRGKTIFSAEQQAHLNRLLVPVHLIEAAELP